MYSNKQARNGEVSAPPKAQDAISTSKLQETVTEKWNPWDSKKDFAILQKSPNLCFFPEKSHSAQKSKEGPFDLVRPCKQGCLKHHFFVLGKMVLKTLILSLQFTIFSSFSSFWMFLLLKFNKF